MDEDKLDAAKANELHELITLDEAARRIGRSVKTLYNWVYIGKLGGAQGLYQVAGKPMVDWPAFAEYFVRRAA